MSILILGDYIIDEYWMGTTSRLSPEAPVPVIKDIKGETKPGGAAVVALNMQSMGSTVRLISQCARGDDAMLEGLERTMLPCEQTPIKTRIITDDHVICRLDIERYQRVVAQESWITDDINICVLSDYDKGFLADSQSLIDWCNDRGIRTIVDPKRDWSNYRNCWLLKSNALELRQQLGGRDYEPSELDLICPQLATEFGIQNLVITLGSRGLYAWNWHGGRMFTSAHNRVADVTGAGDVVLAALAHYINSGSDLDSAASKANALAGIAVSKRGAYIVQPGDLAEVEQKVVFTNGCFDILHRGHLDYLRRSRSLGSKLIVGLNSDHSVRALKGLNRPINNQWDRKAVLESLEFVDEVIIFDEPTPRELILKVKPDIITKGGDYTVDQVVGNDLVNRVEIIPLVEGYSTTGMLEKMR